MGKECQVSIRKVIYTEYEKEKMLEIFDYVNLGGILLEIVGFFILLPRITKWIRQKIQNDYVEDNERSNNPRRVTYDIMVRGIPMSSDESPGKTFSKEWILTWMKKQDISEDDYEIILNLIVERKHRERIRYLESIDNWDANSSTELKNLKNEIILQKKNIDSFFGSQIAEKKHAQM